MHLIPDKAIHLILLGEAINNVNLVLPHPLDQIRCDAHIQSAISSASQQVYAGLLAHFAIPANYVIPAQAGIQLGLSKNQALSGYAGNYLISWIPAYAGMTNE